MRVKDNGDSITLWASANDTWAWANLTIDGREAGDIDGHELSSVCADLLSGCITSDHPCWHVTVGQFN